MSFDSIPGVTISLGESISTPSHGSLKQYPHARSKSESAALGVVPYISKLPPAVANVPADHVRGYMHSKKVNKYLVGNTLGEGSFAKVKEAFHVDVGEKVAMKIIDKKKAQQDPYVAKNFRREAKLLQMVHHPNILQLLEVIETDSSFYLITELCSGGELMNYIYKKGRLDEDETRKYMRQIVSAVDHLHKAGVIHRDLKVENMLLDSNQDLRIIDFGLSNEEYVEGDQGKVHCNTQCGSPAYAAPELLGHKQYGPEVDIWSIGVNMYAMLTGCLPYTVEPFNITALHAKMLENKMNPIPEQLSSNCKDLLGRLLRSNPDERIKMPEIMVHPWINEGHSVLFAPAPYPNKLSLNSCSEDVMDHMVNVLKVKESTEELTMELISNRATTSAAIYNLLMARLTRYNRQFHPRMKRTHHKTKRVSRDQGFFEAEEDDTKSTMSCPARTRRLPPPRTPAGGIKMTMPMRPRRVSKEPRPFSDEGLIPEVPEVEPSLIYRRRMSTPAALLEKDMEKMQHKRGSVDISAHTQQQHHYQTTHATTTGKSSTFPRQNRPGAANKQTRREHYRNHSVHHDPHEHDLSPPQASLPPQVPPENSLAPVRPPPTHNTTLTRNSYSHSKALNELRNDLSRKLHPVTTTPAWHSNPGSRNISQHGSRNPSRPLSRAPSSGSIYCSKTSNDSSELADLETGDDLSFHQADSYTAKYSSKHGVIQQPRTGFNTQEEDPATHLPSIHVHAPPPRSGKRTHSDNSEIHRHKVSNGLLSQTGAMEVRTELQLDAVLSELLRVTGNLYIRELEQKGATLVLTKHSVRFQVTASKDNRYNVCRLQFQWLSGGDLAMYKNLCEQILKEIQL